MKFALLILSLACAVADVALAYPSEHDSSMVVVTSRSRDRDTGRVLFAWDSVLVLWHGPEAYTSTGLTAHAHALQIPDVERITVMNETDVAGRFAGGALVGFLVGFGVGSGIASITEGETLGQAIGLAAFVGVIVAIPGAIYSGIAALIGGIDDHFHIKGNPAAYHDCLPRLWNCAIINTRPPEELEKFIAEKYGR